jgi:hypothetical protein
LEGNPGWEVFSHEFSCEQTASRWVSESNEEKFFYEFKEIPSLDKYENL